MNNEQEILPIKDDAILKCCGIYAIKCILTGKVYVGSSMNMQSRYGDHYRGLMGNKHHNSKLQLAYNNHPTSLYFEVIEACPVKVIREREDYWINKYNSVDEGFNISRISSHSSCVSPEKRRKINKKSKDVIDLVDFYNSMDQLSLYKDKDITDELSVAIRSLNINDRNGKTSPRRLAKFGKLVLRLMDEIYSLGEGDYKIYRVNYLSAQGEYDLKPIIKETTFTKLKTNHIYDRFVDLILEDLSETKIGRDSLAAMERKGIELKRA